MKSKDNLRFLKDQNDLESYSPKDEGEDENIEFIEQKRNEKNEQKLPYQSELESKFREIAENGPQEITIMEKKYVKIPKMYQDILAKILRVGDVSKVLDMLRRAPYGDDGYVYDNYRDYKDFVNRYIKINDKIFSSAKNHSLAEFSKIKFNIDRIDINGLDITALQLNALELLILRDLYNHSEEVLNIMDSPCAPEYLTIYFLNNLSKLRNNDTYRKYVNKIFSNFLSVNFRNFLDGTPESVGHNLNTFSKLCSWDVILELILSRIDSFNEHQAFNIFNAFSKIGKDGLDAKQFCESYCKRIKENLRLCDFANFYKVIGEFFIQKEFKDPSWIKNKDEIHKMLFNFVDELFEEFDLSRHHEDFCSMVTTREKIVQRCFDDDSIMIIHIYGMLERLFSDDCAYNVNFGYGIRNALEFIMKCQSMSLSSYVTASSEQYDNFLIKVIPRMIIRNKEYFIKKPKMLSNIFLFASCLYTIPLEVRNYTLSLEEELEKSLVEHFSYFRFIDSDIEKSCLSILSKSKHIIKSIFFDNDLSEDSKEENKNLYKALIVSSMEDYGKYFPETKEDFIKYITSIGIKIELDSLQKKIYKNLSLEGISIIYDNIKYFDKRDFDVKLEDDTATFIIKKVGCDPLLNCMEDLLDEEICGSISDNILDKYKEEIGKMRDCARYKKKDDSFVFLWYILSLNDNGFAELVNDLVNDNIDQGDILNIISMRLRPRKLGFVSYESVLDNVEYIKSLGDNDFIKFIRNLVNNKFAEKDILDVVSMRLVYKEHDLITSAKDKYKEEMEKFYETLKVQIAENNEEDDASDNSVVNIQEENIDVNELLGQDDDHNESA